MYYTISDKNNCIIVKSDNDCVKIFVDEKIVSKYDVLKILADNSVEPCHAQNVYEDILKS